MNIMLNYDCTGISKFKDNNEYNLYLLLNTKHWTPSLMEGRMLILLFYLNFNAVNS